MLVLLCLGAVAEEPAKPVKVSASRLISVDGVEYLAKRGTREPGDKPFTGIAFHEGDNWRAEVTYKEGILDGEVVVVANNKLLYRFRHEKGRKVLD